MLLFPATWVDYFEVHDDGSSESHTCQSTTAWKMANAKNVRFAVTLGKMDGVPCIIEYLRGSELDGADVRAAYEEAQRLF